MKNIKTVTMFLLFCLFSNYMLLASNDAYVIYNEAINAYRNRKFSEAKQKFSEIIENYPNSPWISSARNMLGQILRDGKEHDKAIKVYKEIIEKDKNFGLKLQAQNSIIDIYYNTQRYKEGIEYINELKKQNLHSDNLDIKLSNFYLQTGRQDEAWLLLEQAFNYSHSKELFKKFLELAVKTNQLNRLINELEEHKNIIPNSQYIDFISDCYLAAGKKNEAIKELKEYSDKRSDSDVLKKLTRLLADEQKHDEAIVYLEKLFYILPYDTVIAKSLGHEYFVTGKIDKAMETWQRPYGRNTRSRDAVIFYTTVLIEHNLYEEALQVFDNYRKETYNQNMFAAEKANVLYALNRHAEAMEEYLASFIDGEYKTETFNKLYEETSPDFSLEKRLLELYGQYENIAIAKALLELYFRHSKQDDIEKISLLVSKAKGRLDNIFLERFCQNPDKITSEFGYELLYTLMNARKDTLLELKLANIAIENANEISELTDKFYDLAKKCVPINKISDYENIASLYSKLAEFALFTKHDPDESIEFADKILKDNIYSYYTKQILDAGYTKAYALICKENIEEAEKIYKEMKTFIDASSDFDKNDYENKRILCEAWLSAHKGDYQKALSELKPLAESNSDSIYVNKAIKLGLIITKFSIGDGLGILDKYFKAKRLTLAGKNNEAAIELNDIITSNASATSVVKDLKADILLLRKDSGSKTLIEEIDEYLKNNMMGRKSADLLELKIKLLYSNKTKLEYIESMKQFVQYFGSDLRSARYRMLISEAEEDK